MVSRRHGVLTSSFRQKLSPSSRHSKSSGCAPGKGGVHILAPSRLRQGWRFRSRMSSKCHSSASFNCWQQLPLTLYCKEFKILSGNDGQECWDQLAMPALGIEDERIVHIPNIC